MLSDAEKKESQRERTAASRARRKEQSANDAAANEQKRKDDFDTWRSANRLVFPGEVEAHINSESVEDALQVAREFLIELNQPDIQPGECLLKAERRSVAAWAEAGCPLLNRNTLRLDMSVASVDGYVFDFDTKWIPLPGSDQPIDVATLAVIERPAEIVEAVAVEIPAPTIEDPVAKQRAIELALRIRETQAAIDADARRISAKNLQRETEREKRLGVGYAYDAE